MASQQFWEAAFSSETDNWETPEWVIKALATQFHWDLDVCASRPNVCRNFVNQEQNGLTQEWLGLCWMNPPYGDEIAFWIAKARLSLQASVVCLVPSRTDTQWWQDNVGGASLIVFIKGRLKFGGQKDSAPFPSAFMVFGGLSQEQINLLGNFGWSIQNLQPNRVSEALALQEKLFI